MSNTTLSPYLNFDGQTKEAMEFYQSILGGELTMSTIGESMPNASPEVADRIMHADLHTDRIQLFASDIMPDMELIAGTNVSLSLVGSDEAGLTEIFHKLGDGGQISVPLAKASWGDTFGMLTDKFGMHWMVNISAE